MSDWSVLVKGATTQYTYIKKSLPMNKNTKQEIKKQIITILLEFDKDAKQGYFHEPRTEQEILSLVDSFEKEIREGEREKYIELVDELQTIQRREKEIMQSWFKRQLSPQEAELPKVTPKPIDMETFVPLAKRVAKDMGLEEENKCSDCGNPLNERHSKTEMGCLIKGDKSEIEALEAIRSIEEKKEEYHVAWECKFTCPVHCDKEVGR